jgi:hypothetical protein
VIFLSDDFKLEQIDGERRFLYVEVVDAHRARKLLLRDGFVSAVRDEGAASEVSQVLGFEVRAAREVQKFVAGDTVVVFRRVPAREGTGNLNYRFYVVKIG